MNAREQTICLRVKKFREGLKWSQADFARQIGISRDQLQSVEYGRTPLRYDIARCISNLFGVGLEWFLGYDAPPQGFTRFALPIPRKIGLPQSAILSEVFDSFAGPDPESQVSEKERSAQHLIEIDSDDMRARALVAALIKTSAESWVCRLPDECAEQFHDAIVKFADSYIKGLPAQLGEMVKARHALLFGERLNVSAAGKIVGRKNNQNLNLTKTASDFIVGRVMKNQWPALKRNLQKATSEPGAKSRLAKFLKVDLTRVSQWLTDAKSAREPGAEYALRMLYWVEHQERQK